MSIDPEALPRQFRYWLLHVSLNALPSFVIALSVLDFRHRPGAVVAMLAGIGFVIGCLTLLTSLEGPLAHPESLPARALKAGVRIRSAISLGGALLAIVTKSGFLLIDLWLGLIACSITEGVGRMLKSGMFPGLRREGFLPVFSTVVVEAVLIAFIVVMISFFALLVIQRRESRKLYRQGFGR